MKPNTAFFTFFCYMSLKSFWQTPLGLHVVTFVRMYVIVFLALYLQRIVQGAQEGQDFVLFNLAVITPAAKWALLAVLTNIYQLIALPIRRTAMAIIKRTRKKKR